jgi:hypothetical protein
MITPNINNIEGISNYINQNSMAGMNGQALSFQGLYQKGMPLL